MNAKKNRKAKNQTSAPAGGLDTRAMLVNLSIAMWEGYKRDKDVTEDVARDNKADREAGAWWTHMIPRAELRAIYAAQARGREIHDRLTLPWNDDGTRILPAAMYLDYSAKMREAREAYFAAVDDFIRRYPQIIADARVRLGGLFRPDWFPTAEQLRVKYRWHVVTMPLPTAGDFRVDLGNDATAKIREEIEAHGREVMATAMRDVWGRLHAQVSKIAERLGDADGIFRDSLIGNVVALCELLPKLNVTNDPALEAMRQEVLARLTTTEPDVLREDTAKRAETAGAANDILERMKAYLA